MIEKLTDLAGKPGSMCMKYSPPRLFSVGISMLFESAKSCETIQFRALSEPFRIGGEGGLSAVSSLAFLKRAVGIIRKIYGLCKIIVSKIS